MPEIDSSLIQDVAKWLQENAPAVYESLNPGTPNTPSKWPVKLRNYYHFFNGQKKNSDFLFPTHGNWLSLEDADTAHAIWSEEYDFDWYKQTYIPIVAYLEQMETALVIDIKTGEIGEVDVERQEFSHLFDDIDGLFQELLCKLKINGYPTKTPYKTYSEEELDEIERQEALRAEEEYYELDSKPSSEQLFIWGLDLFRHKGDPTYSKPKPHFMRLAKKYFDQIPPSHLSKKQIRDITFFNHRYQQIVKDI